MSGSIETYINLPIQNSAPGLFTEPPQLPLATKLKWVTSQRLFRFLNQIIFRQLLPFSSLWHFRILHISIRNIDRDLTDLFANSWDYNSLDPETWIFCKMAFVFVCYLFLLFLDFHSNPILTLFKTKLYLSTLSSFFLSKRKKKKGVDILLLSLSLLLFFTFFCFCGP